jgi:hypothetical protein
LRSNVGPHLRHFLTERGFGDVRVLQLFHFNNSQSARLDSLGTSD